MAPKLIRQSAHWRSSMHTGCGMRRTSPARCRSRPCSGRRSRSTSGFRASAASWGRRHRPPCYASCWPRARFVSLIDTAIHESRTPTRCAACRRCTARSSTQWTSRPGSSVASECKLLAHPASVDTIPTDGSKEDVVPMAMGAGSKLRRIIANLRYVLGIELLCAAQGVDYRAPLKPGRGVARAHAQVRRLVRPLEHDRVLASDIGLLSDAIAQGLFASRPAPEV